MAKKKPAVSKNDVGTTKQSEIVTSEMGFVTGTNIPRKRNKVAICGFAPSTMRDVQFVWDDPDTEIWGLNQLYVAFPAIVEKATRWFQIHHRHSYDQTINRDHSHHQWLGKQMRFPIYMQRQEPDVPMSVPFPVDLILANFRRYFTNSISWEIALAILEGFKTIYIFGVDMAQDSEYQFERPSVEYFCGFAEGRGIKLIVPEKSDLLKAMWLYPFENVAPFRTKMQSRRVELRDRAAQLGQQTQSFRDQHMQILGALENMNYIEKCWVNAANEQIINLEKPQND